MASATVAWSCFFHSQKCTFKKIPLSNPCHYEVLATSGTFVGYSRPVLVVGAYVPPSYTAQRASGCLEYVRDVVVELKRKFQDPFIIIGGDFNQWQIANALMDYPDIHEEMVGPTRGNASK